MRDRRRRSCAARSRASRVGRPALVALASIGLFAAAPARAASVIPARAASVIIVRPVNSPPMMVETLVRLKGELTSAGFQTEIVDAPSPARGAGADSRAGLEQVAAQRGADAVV